jgi:two-component system alkaline phosphatase synthesis response regulator PhoP
VSRTILIAEDNVVLAEGIAENLRDEGYETVNAYDGDQALDIFRKSLIDLVILDVMMPVMDGFEVCSRIRGSGSRVPILFLTARSMDRDRIQGLEMGGDDYMTKPFNLSELLARVKGIFRRLAWYQEELREKEEKVRFGESEIDFRTYTAVSKGNKIELSQKECMIMKVLSANEGNVVSRDQILESVWGMEAYPTSRTVDNFIVRLRKYFEPDPIRPRYIHTIRSVGYKFTGDGE